MAEPAERTFVVTQQQLLELLGEDGGAKLSRHLAASVARTRGGSDREEIRLIVQGGRVVELIPHQVREKVLPPKPLTPKGG